MKLQEKKYIADKLYKEKKYNEAIKEYTKAIEKNSSEYSFYNNRAGS
jgi:hypothetical protein